MIFLMNFQRLRIHSIFICKLLFFCCLLSHSTVKITKLNLLPIRQAPMRIIQWKTNFRRTRLELFSLGSFQVPIFCLFRIFFFRRRFPFSCFRAYLRGRGYRSLTKDVISNLITPYPRQAGLLYDLHLRMLAQRRYIIMTSYNPNH